MPEVYRDAAQNRDFRAEFDTVRGALIQSLPKSILAGKDLRNADLTQSYMPGVDFSGSRLEGARFAGVVLEEAQFTGAALDGADFTGAEMAHSVLTPHRMTGANFENADLSGATVNAKQGTLHGRFVGTSFRDATISGRVTGYFDNSFFRRVDFAGAELAGVRLHDSLIAGEFFSPMFTDANLLGVIPSMDGDFFLLHASFEGSAFRALSLDGSRLPDIDPDFLGNEWRDVLRNSFGDGTVGLPENAYRPCQWLSEGVSTGPFVTAWRAWRERGGQPWPPNEALAEYPVLFVDAGKPRRIPLKDVPPAPELLPPIEECDWVESP